MSERDARASISPSPTGERAGPPVHLERVLGLWSAVAIVVGTVIGSGIFLVPTRMIIQVGTPGIMFAVWVTGGLLSLFGALTYAELAAAMPEAGGEYVFLSKAYGPFWGYLYSWTQLVVAKSGSIATLGTGFYLYLSVFLPALGGTVATLPFHIGPGGSLLEIRYGQLVSIGVIGVLCVVNYLGVRAGGNLQVFVTALKVLLIGGVIVIGITAGQGSWQHFGQNAGTGRGFAGFFAALVGALWAYDGWNNVSMVSSEIRNPRRNLPTSLIFGTVAVVIIYVLTNVAYFKVLSPSAVANSNQVAASMMARVWGPAGAAAITIAVLISILAALNGSILSGSRVPYAMARDGYFFPAIAKVHPRFHTPGVSIVVLCFWSSVLILSGWYEQLYNFVIFGSWILYGMTAASVFVLRRKAPKLERPYKVIGYPFVPAIFVGVTALLLGVTFFESPRESMMGLVLMLAGVPFFLRFRKTGHATVAGRTISH